MPDRKIIAVIGATGAQGGGVMRAIQADKSPPHRCGDGRRPHRGPGAGGTVQQPPEVYRSFGFTAADDLGNMFQFKRDFNQYFTGARDLGFTRTLNPELQSFEQWLAVHKEQIPLPADQLV
jgi:hypothetical protein